MSLTVGAATAPGVAAALLAPFGLIVGSFLNVVIARVPPGESIVHPPSKCPKCGHPVRARDNVPVLSWLLLRGRCRDCRAPISPRYPLVELATGAAFAGIGGWLGFGWALPAFLYLAAISIALAVIDLDVSRLPDAIVLPSYPVAAVLLAVPTVAARDWTSGVEALIGMAALAGVYFLPWFFGGMGFGDLKLSGVLGLYLGWLSWSHLVVGAFLGFLVGGLGGVLAIVLRGAGLKSRIPYGPYLLLGAWLAVPLAVPIAHWYLATTGLSNL